jgi:D-alanine-D-alanine ligase-like ATP-grasp enzyme
MNTQAAPDRFADPDFASSAPTAILVRIMETKYFTGANLYATASALWIRFAVSEAASANESKIHFLRRLDAAGISGPKLAARAARIPLGLTEPLGLVATALAEVLAHGVIQNTCCQPEIIACQPGGNAIAVTWSNEVEARQALILVHNVFNESSKASIEALRSYFIDLAEKADQPSLSVSLKAAEDRGIPWAWKEGIGYYQLGHGRHRTRIEATITGNLSVLGYDLARRKSVTNKLLRSLALPAPYSILTSDLDSAAAAAELIAYPVVVKPAIGHKGIGITVGVNSIDELAIAFKKARKITKSVIVEQFIPGGDVRLLVAGRKLVAAASRNPPQVTGDNNNTIAQLIEIENTRRRRRPGIALPIEIDHDLTHTLAGQGFNLHSVLPVQAVVRLRTVANWSQGGTATDLTDVVHPDNADMAIRAALAVGIDVAGVDFITPDISRPYYEVGGAICEINYRPGLRVHMAADPERKRDLGSPIIESLFAGGDGRIDLIFLIDAGDGAFASILAKRFADAGKLARVACAYDAPENWQLGIEAALEDPDCDALIINTPAAAIVSLGTGVSYCRLIIRFGNGDAVQESALRILGKICKPECMLATYLARDVDATAARIANILGLGIKPKDRTLPLARATTSRNLWAVAEDCGMIVNERARWDNRPLLQIGYGAKQSVYRGARTGTTSHIAARIADDKRRTNAILRTHGLPNSTQAVVESASAALRAARSFGYPVIVKPTSSSESRGVTGNILNDEELATAMAQAIHFSKKVIVEPFLLGNDHRFLIIGGKAAHVTRHEIAQVTGDGRMTVAKLVTRANENPLRGLEDYKPYTLLDFDEDAMRMLTRQGLSTQSVPKNGQVVMLSGICSLSTGGTAIDVTEATHPDNITAAERAARLVGLDICGVDFFLPDVSKSYRETGGAILEVNQRPSFDMHDASTGSTNRIRSLILRELSDGQEGAQIPLLNCILNDDCLAEAIAHSVLLQMHSRFGLTGGAAVPALGLAMIGSAIIKSADGEATPICNSILGDPRVEAALFLSSSESSAEIPETVKVLDFRSPRYALSTDAITEAIVREFSGNAA